MGELHHAFGHESRICEGCPSSAAKQERAMMKKLLLTTTLAFWALAGPVIADEIDPLHGMICTGAGTGCSNAADNGSFTPLPAGQIANFGFSISPGPATGNLTLAILVPTNTIDVTSFNLPGLQDNGGPNLTSSVFSRVSLFNAGSPDLATYLALANAASFSPTDNFSNASAGETAAINPGFLGSFLAFTATLSGITLGDTSSTTIANDFAFGSNLPAGTVIVGLFVETSGPHPGTFVGTAASADLVITPTAAVPGPIVGAGLPGLVAGCMTLLGLGRWRRKRNGVV
jgi:hypothetical protein